MISPLLERPVFAIGDVQGCYTCLIELLGKIKAFNPSQIWFAGDLVNRGPDSLASLRKIIGLGAQTQCVLGNHDLHLLAASAGVRPPGKRDTLNAILKAPDQHDLIDWLRQQPLAHFDQGYLMVHAGVHPRWTVEQTISRAQEVQKVLQGPDWGDFLATMYGNSPEQWQDELTGDARLRAIVNILTRMRYLAADESLDFSFQGSPEQCPPSLSPWFEISDRATDETPVIFGHWSTMGLVLRPQLIGLDTGCVWGGALTAVNLATRSVLQVPCPQAQAPAPD